MDAVYAEIKAAALESSENTGKPPIPNSYYGWQMCATMLSFMNRSGDETFLPVLEQIGGESPDPDLRERAVKVYIRFKGIDAFGLVKKAVATIPFDGGNREMRPNDAARGGIYMAFLECVSKERPNLSAAQLEPVYAFLVEKAVVETDLPGIADIIDKFLVKEIPEYASSRQRHETVRRVCSVRNLLDRDTFIALKTELDKIPEAKRTDMRQRFKQLPALNAVEEAK
jgi:hypothetical protein